MKGQEKKVDELASIIVDSILEERYLQREPLIVKVTAFIRGFVKMQSAPKEHLKHTKPENTKRHLDALYLKEIECNFWLQIVKDHMTEEALYHLYQQRDAVRIEAKMNM